MVVEGKCSGIQPIIILCFLSKVGVPWCTNEEASEVLHRHAKVLPRKVRSIISIPLLGGMLHLKPWRSLASSIKVMNVPSEPPIHPLLPLVKVMNLR